MSTQRRSRNLWLGPLIPWTLGLALLLTLIISCEKLLADDMFYYADMRLTGDWRDSYLYTCTRRFRDRFRNPQKDWFIDNFHSPQEALSPVWIFTNQTIQSRAEIPLHVYNYPGLVNGYSVSYGFQKNKECLHGADPHCVASPDFGRIRAVVLNAERFHNNENLNYIKDHFLIEEPERHCTILNGGSQYERKFYEAIFLGGYPANKRMVNETKWRSSHVIDGRNYPMEIYMYFVDEAIPTMARTTILVVLVEEVKEDNPLVRPIVNAVNKLYGEEKRFIENNRKTLRQERFFQDLEESLQQDPWDIEGRKVKGKSSVIRGLQTSKLEEAILADHLETFERMQAMEADLEYIKEDIDFVKERQNDLKKIFIQGNAVGEYLTPNWEMYFMALPSQLVPFHYRDNATFRLELNEKESDDIGYASHCIFLIARSISQLQLQLKLDPKENESRFFEELYNDSFPFLFGGTISVYKALQVHFYGSTQQLALNICKYYLERFKWDVDNNNQTKNRVNWKHSDKYRMLNWYRQLRERRDELNKLVYAHFHGEVDIQGFKTPLHTDELRKDFTKYGNGKKDALNFMTRLEEYIEVANKFHKYGDVLTKDLDPALDTIWKRFGFEKQKDYEEAVQYLKIKQGNLRLHREEIHKKIWSLRLPQDQKRRGDAEIKNMDMSEERHEETRRLNPIKVLVEAPFQISWLLPSSGGYFHYDGSSPVPPCFRAQNVIVFKRPLKLSRSQIETLSRIPIGSDGLSDILWTTPIVHYLDYKILLKTKGARTQRLEEVSVPVYSERRRHLFLGQDGVHKNAIELSEMIKKRKEEALAALNESRLLHPSWGKVIRAAFIPLLIIRFYWFNCLNEFGFN